MPARRFGRLVPGESGVGKERLQILWAPLHVARLLPMRSPQHQTLGFCKNWFTEFCRASKCGHFTQFQKQPILGCHRPCQESSLECWKTEFMVADTMFPSPGVCLKAQVSQLYQMLPGVPEAPGVRHSLLKENIYQILATE